MAPRAGFRGGSRGGPRGGGSRGGASSRGRGGMRGRGGGGRGDGRGRGRGRGRATSRGAFGQSRKFEDQRVASKEDVEEEEEDEEFSESESDAMSVDSDSDEEEAPKETGYERLMRAIEKEKKEKERQAKAERKAKEKRERQAEEETEPRAKRRRVAHDAEGEEEEPESGSEGEGQEEEEDSDEERAVDAVEEDQEDPDVDFQPDDLLDDEDDLDKEDPFETHFENPDEKVFLPRIKAAEADKFTIDQVLFQSNRAYWKYPETTQEKPPLPRKISGPSDIHLKERLKAKIQSKRPKFDDVEQAVAPFLFNYNNMLYCDRTVGNSDNLRRLAALHALNHIYKTRDRIIKNNAKISKNPNGNEDLDLRDQGFARPKVLMLLPTRQSCYKMVNMMLSICDIDAQENRKRFEEGYNDKFSKASNEMPEDFRDLFEGNTDDIFRLGVKFTRKTIKYFSKFYNSDIIFASPLGLRMAIGSKEEKKLDYDYLSSIEVVIVDQADALLMQNWDHLEFIFEHLNLQPTDTNGCDVFRARHWYLDNQAKYFRQTVVFSAFSTLELTGLMSNHCPNWSGSVRLQKEYPGKIQHLPVKTRQTFSRFEAPEIETEADARFDYFTKAIVPLLTKHNARDATGTLIFVPDSLDFPQVRNYFAFNPAMQNVSFGKISEHTPVPEASRARSHFLTGRMKVLLITERAMHFFRYQSIRGVKRVIYYGLPDNSLFYSEIASFLLKSEQSGLLEPEQGVIRVMFNKWDHLKLERIVGSSRVGKMLHEKGDTFDFV
ncbi:hypothetical protein QBC35DRAFT_427709 [Podospora australis]|uniref:U3 small nucleolar RNA-associated protein 25 n=1 Tax=Podospora australis TaxID=1536484 RepID=A0AAN6X0G8_9PEZI|nr:hypothetical protein QBC35DRAFT_427709 [Podospora australis]